MARLIECKNKIFVVSDNVSIKISKKEIERVWEHKLTGVITVETKFGKVVFSPESIPMLFPK